jgi:hypothetical protein
MQPEKLCRVSLHCSDMEMLYSICRCHWRCCTQFSIRMISLFLRDELLLLYDHYTIPLGHTSKLFTLDIETGYTC